MSKVKIHKGGKDYTNGAFDYIVVASKELSDKDISRIQDFVLSTLNGSSATLKEENEELRFLLGKCQGMLQECASDAEWVGDRIDTFFKYSPTS